MHIKSNLLNKSMVRTDCDKTAGVHCVKTNSGHTKMIDRYKIMDQHQANVYIQG